MQEAFFFESDRQPIFGVYHPALGADSGVLTVICPPLFSELNRTYAALRSLALALVQKGHHVLRFDYSGSGDSYGELSEATLSDWINEIDLAINEGRDLSGCRRVRIVGVRGSALLASKAIGRNASVDRVVLWDPVRDGNGYLSSLDREQDASLMEHLYLDSSERRSIKSKFDLYPVSEQMLSDLRSIGADTYESLPQDKVRVVRTSSTQELGVAGIAEISIEFNCNWETKNGEVIMCQPVMEQLLECLTAS
ncbi:MAG: hypothetical protein OEV58_04740 [Gammaproteobacteria bacterium]|nr:hypothetical protein [Gammaproteobacteria bacterium]MDH5262519.1 hypothetical protein [Gammaproteobacteria bacterium]